MVQPCESDEYFKPCRETGLPQELEKSIINILDEDEDCFQGRKAIKHNDSPWQSRCREAQQLSAQLNSLGERQLCVWLLECTAINSQLVKAGVDLLTPSNKSRLFQYLQLLPPDVYNSPNYWMFLQELTLDQLSAEMLLGRLIADFLSLVRNSEGCRSLQVLLARVGQEWLQQVERLVEPELESLVTHQHANYVVTRLVDLRRAQLSQSFGAEVVRRFDQFATHMSGCRIVKKCIEVGPLALAQELVGLVLARIEILSICRYGNYVVQLVQGREDVRAEVQRVIIKNFLAMSLHPVAFNVVNRQIGVAVAHRRQLFECLVDKETFVRLCRDNSGCNVVQQFYRTGNQSIRRRLLEWAKTYQEELKKTGAGVKVLAAIR